MFPNKEYLKGAFTPELVERMQQELQDAQERDRIKG